ncbi:lamin tail domain-containing protein [Pontiellaceae bacterium B12227]|nr:lamin tail domain-containing protein [Pontiellaceae bacterium B12227]
MNRFDTAFAALLLGIAASAAPVQAEPDVIISEFLAVNSNGLEDEDGDRSDWIELFNAGSEAVNLGGWHLTDKADDLTKWEISPVVLGPGDFRLIRASNKNRKDPDEELHTNFKLSGGGEYLALVNPDGVVVSDYSPEYPAQVDDVSFGVPVTLSSNQVLTAGAPCSVFVPTDDSLELNWTQPGFDDTGWIAGQTGIGYERTSGYEGLFNMDVESIMYNVHPTIYTRIPFVVPEGTQVNQATLRLWYDDGFRAYINGEPIASANISGTYAWDEDALEWIESSDFETYQLSGGSAFVSGTNILAIHGVNDRSNSSDFLLLPELTLFSSELISGQNPLYFSTPTPGAGNIGGTENIGPQFSKEQHLPFQPLETEDLNVSVKVIDEADGVAAITMTYEIMFNGETTVPMTHSGDDLYTATIPSTAYAAGEMIRYRFNAEDGAGNTSRWPLFYDPLNSPEFFGTMAQIAVTSSMPVYHWFVATTNIMDSGNESRSSIFYDGKLYDNIMTRTRGGSTENTSIIKKSHKFDFNRGHHFEYDASERKVEEMNLNTTYSDKTYLRRMLAWNSYEKVGAPGCKSFLVHLRRNNAFFGVQNFEEQLDEDYLLRHDYDENGKLYKVIGWGTDEPDTAYKTHRVAQKTRKEDTDTSDVHALVHGIQTPEKESFVFDNMDVANVLNYLCLTALMRDGDTAAKNHYYYRDTDGTGDWSVFPWDKDLVFGMTWNKTFKILHDGSDPANNLRHPSWGLLQKAVWDSPDLKALYLRRLRSVLDELLQPSSTPLEERYYENLISDLLATHGADLLLDYNKWGNSWAYGINFTPEQANADRTVSAYLNPTRTYFYSQSLLPAAQAASPNIQISHVEVTPVSGNQAEEYIELYNPNSTAVDLSGWSLSNAVTHVFRSGSVVLPNDYFYVSPDTGAFRSRSVSPKGGEKRFVQGSYKGMLSSRGETLELYDAAGTLKDTETWAEDLSNTQRYLRITEVMYHPALPDGSDLTEDRLEFVELKNIGTGPLNIGGTFFSEGLVFTNPAVTIPAGGYVVVASDPVEFALHYNTAGMTVLGPFAGYLANGNDSVELEDARGETIQRFEYNDDWYDNTDGKGFSLTLIDPSQTNAAAWNYKASWRPSLNTGGSPGNADIDLAPESVIINEVLAHSDTGGDWVEIRNMTSSVIDLSHWFLSDDWNNLKKYALPNSTLLPADGFIVLHESQFNSGPDAFALSELGDEIILSKALSDGTLQGYQVSHDFNASGKDVSLGRWIDSEGDAQFIPMAAQTAGMENSEPKSGPVLISEIKYFPTLGKTEYIELYNAGTEPVSLYDTAYPTNGWSLTDAASFTFPTGTTLDSGEFLIVCATNPLAFRIQYSVPMEIDVFGPMDGNLNNGGEHIRLNYPGNPEPALVPQIQIESVNYKPIAPWPVINAGQSIERISTTAPANDPVSWRAADGNGTPGSSPLSAAGITTLSDDWKTTYFGSPAAPLSGETDDFDADGQNNLAEFIAGTNPTNRDDFASLSIQLLQNGRVEVSIPTRKTDPSTDFGLKRLYTLQQLHSLTGTVWGPVSGATEIPGNGTILTTEQSPDGPTVFTRATIELK